jgi:hypothetical protein
MCYCIIKDIPSIYCVVCGELFCVICFERNKLLKCDSCYSFYCNECGVELDCEHNYCSVNCVLQNNNNKCDNKCFFFRDLYVNQDIEKVISYWENKCEKEILLEWIEEYRKKLQ